MSQTVTVETAGGELSAHVARPARSPAPAVIVLHEIFGVNDDIRLTCRELADQGFIALASLPSAIVYSYPGQNHAFARHTRLHDNAEEAALANGRTAAFLAEHLDPERL